MMALNTVAGGGDVFPPALLPQHFAFPSDWRAQEWNDPTVMDVKGPEGLLPVGSTFNSRELLLEFQAARSLSNTINLITNYTDLPEHLEDSLKALKELAETVLRDLGETKASAGEARPPCQAWRVQRQKGHSTRAAGQAGLSVRAGGGPPSGAGRWAREADNGAGEESAAAQKWPLHRLRRGRD